MTANRRAGRDRARSWRQARPGGRLTLLAEQRSLVAIVLLASAVVGAAVVILLVQEAKFAYVDPMAWAGVETASAFARLFAALILLLFPDVRAGARFRWLAGGMLVLGLGWLTFGYLRRLLDETPSLNQSMYSSLLVWTIAGSLFAIGLVPNRPPQLTGRVIAVTVAAFAAGSLLVFSAAGRLPRLIAIDDLTIAAQRGETPLRGLSGWHWALSTLPLLLALAAVLGAIRHRDALPLGDWLAMAMVLLAGSQLHNLLWPSAYSPILTTANLLRLGFAAVVVIGGTLELRRIATERAAYASRLAELARLKADFTSMVAHELGSPLSAIRGYGAMLALNDLDTSTRTRAIAAIQRETELLNALVEDVRASAAIERDDFAVQLRPVPLDEIIDDAAMYARTLPGNHPLSIDPASGLIVVADRERIGQVLRNLLSNAAKYSLPDTPIAIRVSNRGQTVLIEVEDRGFGIHPDDLEYVFEKFGRGRDRAQRMAPGVGLGLYLSERIVSAHGSRLTVASQPDQGSIFSFELRATREPTSRR